jgi:hypothetical protein
MGLFGPKKSKSTRATSYYDRENLIHTLKDLGDVYTPEPKQQFDTNELIRFNNFALADINKKALIQAIGNPDKTIDDLEQINDYEIFFYRHSVDKFNFLMQFHFCKDDFLFVNNLVKSSYILQAEDKRNILKRIQNKYFPDVALDFAKGLNIKITDKTGNFMFSKDAVNFSITYINNTPVIKKLVSTNSQVSSSSLDLSIDEYF